MTCHVPEKELPSEITALETVSKKMWDDIRMLPQRHALEVLELDDAVASVLPEDLKQTLVEDLGGMESLLVMLRDTATTNRKAVEELAAADGGVEGAALVDEADEPEAEEGGNPSGTISATQIVALTAAMSGGITTITPIFDKVVGTVNKLQDRFTAVDSEISNNKSAASKLIMPQAPWNLLAAHVRTVLSSAGDLEMELGAVRQALDDESKLTQSLQEELEAAGEKIQPMQRAIKQKELSLGMEQAKAADAQKQLVTYITSMEELTKDLKRAEEEIIQLKKKGTIGRRGVERSPARGSPAKFGDSAAGGDAQERMEMTDTELETQRVEREALLGTLSRLRESKKRVERQRAVQKLSWLAEELPALKSRGDPSAAPPAGVKAGAAALEIASVMASIRTTHATAKVIDLTGPAPSEKPEENLALQKLSSAQVQLGMLASRRRAAESVGRGCLSEAAQGVSRRSMRSFLRQGAPTGSAIGRLQVRRDIPQPAIIT